MESGAIYCRNGGDKSDVVISGVSGRFHKSNNMQEFKDYIYSKEAQKFIKRQKKEYFTSISCTSYLKDLSQFDAKFFNMSKPSANRLEPQLRMLFEVVYEAIVDSGYTLDELSRMSVGTYCASSENPALDLGSRNPKIPLSVRLMTENFYSSCVAQVSHFFNFKGPCILGETGCASSFTILKEARDDIRRGKCDMAIIIGVHIVLQSFIPLFRKERVMTKHGFLRPFDAKASGFTSGEAISAILVQRAGSARRIYASIVDVMQTTMGYNPQSIFSVSIEKQIKLTKRFYATVDVNLPAMEYVELHGTGTRLGDAVESGVADTVFCNGRKEPLLIGSAKSNFGHCEEASGFVALMKIILGFEIGKIAPNVNFDTPNPDCTAIVEGRLKVVVDPTDINCDYIPINNYGIGGVITHGCFKRNPVCIKEDSEMSSHGIPKLFVFASPSKEGVQSLIDCVKTHGASKELASLLHKVAHGKRSDPYRGYYLNWKNQAVQDIQRQRIKKRPLFYIFGSMGCQWPGMGLDLLKFAVFSNSIMKSAEILKGLGINLLEILKPTYATSPQSRNIIPAFVSITAIQIALVDLLNSLGLEPDGIIGHSTGEMACAYADGCCTAEQVLLLSYWRGKSVENADLIKGKMATIALSMEEAHKLCPKDVYVVCHNAPKLVTISGPAATVNKFLQQLKGKGVLSVIVKCFNYAFHSVHVAPAVEELHRELSKVLHNSRKISNRWISTSYAKEELHLSEAKTADASYFVHNLLSPVRFHEALLEIPKEAVLLEIGPHHMFESILKQVVGPDADFLALMREKADNVKFFLENIGKLYNAEFDPMIENLYTPPNYPVPRNTPMISSCIKWDHAQKCHVPSESCSSITIDIEAAEDIYLKDHAIADKVLFPGTGYLVAVWQVFAEAYKKSVSELPVILEHVRFITATILQGNEQITMMITISVEDGHFEIRGKDGIIASGFIRISKEVSDPKDFPNYKSRGDVTRVLTTTDIHDMIKILGYQHGPEFQNILEYDIGEFSGLLKWRNNWITFLDSMLIFMFLNMKLSTLMLPVGLEFVKLDPVFQREVFEKNPDFLEKGVPVFFDAFSSRCVTVGAEMCNSLVLPTAVGSHQTSIVHEEHLFVPFCEDCILSDDEKSMYKSYHDCCITEVCEIGHLLKTDFKLKSKITKVPDSVLIPSENQLLLNTLKNLRNQLENRGHILNPKQTYINYSAKHQNDYLCRTLLTNETLKKIFDIIEENTFDITIQAIEMSSSCFPMSFQISELVRRTHFKKWEFTVAHTVPSIIYQELFKKQGVIVEKFDDWGLLESKTKHVLICSFLGGSELDLKKFISLLSCIHTDGFFVVLYRSEISQAEKILQELCETPVKVYPLEVFEEILAEEQILSVARKSNSFGMHLYLLKTSVCQDTIMVRELSDDFSEWVPETIEAVKELEENKNSFLWIVSIADPRSGILGFVNCLQREPNGERIKCIFISDKNGSSIPNFDKDDSFYADVIEKSLLFNVFKDGTWGTYRHRIIKGSVIKDCRHIKASVKKVTDLSSLRWTNAPLSAQFETNDSIEVYYGALNFHDVVVATGRIVENNNASEQNVTLGLEFSGRNIEGKRVFGILPSGLVSTICLNEHIWWFVPDHWTMEQACTIPVVYMTCFGALICRGKLQNGEKILIHSATGGIGQAAINIALSMKCEIFATVGTEKKRKYLFKKFPQLKPENVGYSRDTSFKNVVLQQTQGKGVDVILNFLIEDKLQVGLECLSSNGRFIDIGKYDLMMDNFLYLESLPENASFIAFHVHNLMNTLSPTTYEITILRKLQEIVKENIENGVVKPLDTIVFEKEKLEDSFRYLAAGKHFGKVIVKVRDEEPDLITKPVPVTSQAEMTTFFHSAKCYLIIGGLGGFAMSLVDWMISRGARKFVLSSRSGSLTGFHKFRIQAFQNMGANIEVAKLDASDANEAKELFLVAERLGPVGGVFNLALVLKDALFPNQTLESFSAACASKAAVTENIDKLTREFYPDLDWFVCFSSISSGKGNAGQTNYGYGNSVMERICEIRRKDGLHGLAIQWGVIGDVGVVHRSGLKFANSIIGPQPILSCLSSLDELLHRDQPVVCCFLKNVESSELYSTEDHWKRLLKILGIGGIDAIDTKSTLGQLGADSLTLMELQRFLEKICHTNLKQDEILKMTIDEIQNLCQNPTQNIASSLSPIAGLLWINKTNKVKLNEQMNGTPLFILVSGNHIYELKAFVDLLKVPVYGMLINRSEFSSREENEAFIKGIQEETLRKIKFNLAGYGGDGTIIATQVAIRMKRSPHKYPLLHYFFIISGYTAIRDLMQRKQPLSLSSNIDRIMDIMTKWTGFDVSTIKDALQKLDSIEEQIDLATDFLFDIFSSNTIERQTIRDALYQEYVLRTSPVTTPFSGKLLHDAQFFEVAEETSGISWQEMETQLSEIYKGNIDINILSTYGSSLLQPPWCSDIAAILEGKLNAETE